MVDAESKYLAHRLLFPKMLWQKTEWEAEKMQIVAWLTESGHLPQGPVVSQHCVYVSILQSLEGLVKLLRMIHIYEIKIKWANYCGGY